MAMYIYIYIIYMCFGKELGTVRRTGHDSQGIVATSAARSEDIHEADEGPSPPHHDKGVLAINMYTDMAN
jgi:hypothetical protein